jgi:hypothetical protein
LLWTTPLLKTIPASKISLPFSIFPTSFVHFFSHFYTYPNSPFLFPFYSPFLVTILKSFFQNGRFPGWWTRGSSSLSTLSYHESDRQPHYHILSCFCNRGFPSWWVSSFCIPCSVTYICTQMICDLIFDHWTPQAPKHLISPILNLTNRIKTLSQFSTFCNGKFAGSQVGGFTKVPNVIFSHPSPPPSHFSQYTFVWFNDNKSSCRSRKDFH